MQLLGGDNRKTLRQIETHLIPEHAQGARTGAILFTGSVFAHMAHEIEILLHSVILIKYGFDITFATETTEEYEKHYDVVIGNL